MAKIRFAGPLGLRVKSFAKLCQIAVATSVRHKTGRRMADDWDAQMETGVLFVRHQFTKALGMSDIARGRLLFDSVQLETDDVYDVEAQEDTDGNGIWYHPKIRRSEAVMLYLHGGGYTFHGGVSARFAKMLAHHTGARVFAADYRLTPEHAHPAQADDAMAAWDYVAAQVPADRIVLVGDSAGGHMVLMLLQALRAAQKPQPALCIGLCPWTDIGDRGASLRDNDPTDLVQGWMALQFGRWLDPDNRFGREALSPIFHDYRGLAPLYLQAGGREVLRDMIVEFAQAQAALGVRVDLDVWADMPHDFQAYDSLHASSRQAVQRIVDVIEAFVGVGPELAPIDGVSVVHGGQSV